MKLKSKMSMLIIFLVFIPLFCCPIMARADPGTYEDFYADSFQVYGGTYLWGDLESTKSLDLDAVWVLADWFWFFGFWFNGDIRFTFPNQVYDYVIVAMVDNTYSTNFMLHVYYTYGAPDHLPQNAGDWPNGWLGDGLYQVPLDERPVESIYVSFSHASPLWGDRFFYVDQIVCRNNI